MKELEDKTSEGIAYNYFKCDKCGEEILNMVQLHNVAEKYRLMKKYHDLPMDLADATLVRVAEREGIRRLFTLDRRDFSVYRAGRGRSFSIIP
mgnify:CR=1 FL=1